MADHDRLTRLGDCWKGGRGSGGCAVWAMLVDAVPARMRVCAGAAGRDVGRGAWVTRGCLRCRLARGMGAG
jgi:hypothetical protein